MSWLTSDFDGSDDYWLSPGDVAALAAALGVTAGTMGVGAGVSWAGAAAKIAARKAAAKAAKARVLRNKAKGLTGKALKAQNKTDRYRTEVLNATKGLQKGTPEWTAAANAARAKLSKTPLSEYRDRYAKMGWKGKTLLAGGAGLGTAWSVNSAKRMITPGQLDRESLGGALGQTLGPMSAGEQAAQDRALAIGLGQMRAGDEQPAFMSLQDQSFLQDIMSRNQVRLAMMAQQPQQAPMSIMDLAGAMGMTGGE